jgi:adenine deaminase
MSLAPAEKVVGDLAALSASLRRLGGIRDAFMYASFLSLPVIPAIRITPRGLFDVAAHHHIGLFAD